MKKKPKYQSDDEVQHDSYTCHTFPGSKGFPTEVPKKN